MEIRSEFSYHALNAEGRHRAEQIAHIFSKALNDIEDTVGVGPSRELSLVKTKMEEASFFAKKAVALQHENQQF